MAEKTTQRSANVVQRTLPVLLFLVVAAMIWAAHSGRYDHAINHLANWLHRHVDAIVHWR